LYAPFFDAIVFTSIRCGFAPRCALEIDDGAGTRIEKILKLIAECPLGIHDISRTEIDEAIGLPRFNMPFELGLFIGAHKFGNSSQRKKRCLILDREKFRYRNFISDIAGQDIKSHDNDPQTTITRVRDFLRANSGGRNISGGAIIKRDYLSFMVAKPKICAALELDLDEITFLDLTYLIAYFLKEKA
ncbi:MAG: hypothetical protein ACREF6_20945, partial [Alphaproteobacteria bacterium]